MKHQHQTHIGLWAMVHIAIHEFRGDYGVSPMGLEAEPQPGPKVMWYAIRRNRKRTAILYFDICKECE